MSDQPQQQQTPAPPSPALIFETINAYQRTAALRTAIELELFTAIAEGASTAPELAQRCRASERGVRILSDYLTVLGFLTKAGPRYGLSQDAAVFLDARSPAYMGGAIEFLLDPTMTDAFADLTATVRRGTCGQGTVAPEHPVWVKFARAMKPLMAMPAERLAQLVECPPDKSLKVLDLAAGHGVFGIAFARRYPRAEIVAQDWPQVLEVARENARASGVAGRYRALPGSAFDVAYGDGYDLVLLTNFLHHFDKQTNETLLRKVRASLADGGRAVALEFIPNEDRVSPPGAAAFSLTMLGSTPSGDAYTFSEFEDMFGRAGFSRSELHPLPPTMEQVVIAHR
uniref:Hydroxyindole O-methyltransferase n=1 Tax=uncultured Armatimonadetes bacterium TaxID=157466 RepID=A0A6J4H0C4_9BACT|nr:Hydroxyindole O-methyltransferase [uncultured Armatimonadetes bacterium]